MALTLLDGTTLTLPTRPKPTAAEGTEGAAEASAPDAAAEPSPHGTLLAALRALAHGGDPGPILAGDARWEALFMALFSALLKRGLISEAELLEELKQTRPPRS